MGTPQAILIIITIFFVFLLIHAYRTSDRFWHYLAGAIMLAAIPMHGLALLIFAAWLVTTAWLHPRRPYFIPLLLALAALSVPFLQRYLPQVLSDIHLNLSFPASFTTIDGVPNGWPGLSGLLQYYGFYLGPTLPVLFIISLLLFYRYPAYRRQIANLLTHPSTLALFIILAGFFIIAEVLPRFFNIAILPERAWLFASLASVVLFIPFYQTSFPQKKLLAGFLILLFSVNLGGAIYINNLKKHLIPDYAIQAMLWINTNLPANAVVALNTNHDYLDLYAPRSYITLPSSFFCSPASSTANKPAAAYALFIKPDPKNPYANRPWHDNLDNHCSSPTLSHSRHLFQEIYNQDDQAIIWQII